MASTLTLNNTPQASADSYAYTEQALIDSGLLDVATNVVTLDVMANDAGGKAKTLYSVDDGQGALTDLLTSNVSTGWEHTFNAGGSDTGILIRIYNGKVQLDLTGALDGGSVADMTDGETLSGSFLYAIRLGNGTLSYATITFSVTGEGATQVPPIVGTDDSETIFGTDGNDTILALGGDDTVHGANGDDVIYGGEGLDALYGEGGDDEIHGGLASGPYGYSESLFGGDGNDTLVADEGADAVAMYGEAGNDTLRGGDGPASMFGGDGEDTLTLGAGGGYMGGEAGNDTLIGGSGGGYLTGGAGDDLLVGGSGNTYLFGDTGNDTLVRGVGTGVMDGGAGDDTLTGGDGNDVMYGGTGSDVMYGGAGDDTLFTWDTSAAYLEGDHDQLFGGAGNDILIHGGAAATLNGGAGSDFLYSISGSAKYVFSTALGAGDAFEGIDSIPIFHADDRIALDTGVGKYAGLVAQGDALSDGQFMTINSGVTEGLAAGTASILYNADTGALLYDADGGDVSNAVQFATITQSLVPITASSFTLLGG